MFTQPTIERWPEEPENRVCGERRGATRIRGRRALPKDKYSGRTTNVRGFAVRGGILSDKKELLDEGEIGG